MRATVAIDGAGRRKGPAAFVGAQRVVEPDHKLGELYELNARRIDAVDAAGNRRTVVTEDAGRISSPSWSPDLNLRALVRYGMTPYEALRTATALPPQQIGVGDELGTVEPGKVADLILVEGNPLERIDDAANVRGAMNGRLDSTEELLAPYETP